MSSQLFSVDLCRRSLECRVSKLQEISTVFQSRQSVCDMSERIVRGSNCCDLCDRRNYSIFCRLEFDGRERMLTLLVTQMIVTMSSSINESGIILSSQT